MDNTLKERDDLARIVRQLIYQIRKVDPDNVAASRALDYLKRKNLQGSPLREVRQPGNS